MWKEINQVINEYVQPIFQQHGGYVEPIEYQDGILKITMKGRCSNCPAAAAETEEVVAKQLKQRIPEIKQVILVNQIDEGLIDFARKVLQEKRRDE